ncbi:MAG: hypothetical protein QGI44_00600 [Candidatus Marinimicrobia bacterium]|jgi:hypothetical protein|nr:hypothetical protein [Candidatus Neomarinimicrobiota bacterium]
MKKFLSFILLSYILSSCVGPPDPDHGLVENLPVVINTPSAFSFSARGDNFTLDEAIDLSFNLQAGKSVASTLIVTDWKGKDTTYVNLEDVNGSLIYKYTVTGNGTAIDQSATTAPKKALIKGSKFTGIIAWTVTAN